MSDTWTHSFQDLEKKNGVCNCIFCVKEAFSPKKRRSFALFCLNGFGFINSESQESDFSMVFHMFVLQILNKFKICFG